jgi:hypothetical protein
MNRKWSFYVSPTDEQVSVWQARHGFSDEQAATWLHLEAGEVDDPMLPRAKFYLFALSAYVLFGAEAVDEWAADADNEHESDRVTPWSAYFWQYASINMPDSMYEDIQRELVAIIEGPEWWKELPSDQEDGA